MANIEENLLGVIRIEQEKFSGDERISQFEETVNRFDELIAQGLACKRGNNLLSLTDTLAKTQVVFNVPG
ncbi:MAG: hypothetical protein ACRBFS_24270 [Aureispira sp.]